MEGGIILLGMGIFLVILLIVGFVYMPSEKPTTSSATNVPSGATGSGYFSGIEDELSSYFSTGLASTPAPTTPDGVTSIAPSAPVPEQPVLQQPVLQQPVAPAIPATLPDTAPPEIATVIPTVERVKPWDLVSPTCAPGSYLDPSNRLICVKDDKNPAEDSRYTSCPSGSNLVRGDNNHPGSIEKRYFFACLKTVSTTVPTTNTNNQPKVKTSSNPTTSSGICKPGSDLKYKIIDGKLKQVCVNASNNRIATTPMCPDMSTTKIDENDKVTCLSCPNNDYPHGDGLCYS